MKVKEPGMRKHAGEERRSFDLLSFLSKHEFLVPMLFFFLFLSVTLPGISWGAPSIWHPDEVVLRSIKALDGEWDYYEANFNHPFLPQNVMYLVGKGVVAFGGEDGEVLIAARIISALILGATIVLAYYITRRAGGNIYLAGLSSLLLICTSEMMHNGHFAHTDPYVTFFSTLTVFFLLQYYFNDQRGWLYAAFLAAGLALSSKYNSILLLLAPVIVYSFKKRSDLSRHPLGFWEPLSLGLVVWALGFGLGTPRFLFWMAYYLKRAVPAFIYNGNYGYQSGSATGVIGQYAVLEAGVGPALFLLFLAAGLWTLYKVIQAYRAKTNDESSRTILFLCILLLDLPIMLSYNFPVRFMLALLPLLAILSSLFVGDLHQLAKRNARALHFRILAAGLALVIMVSFARTISVMLLFLHDARFPASEFLQSLPPATSLEYTFYPPTLPAGKFKRDHNYPIHFLKTANDTIPISTRYIFNAGETGLDERETDYLVVDSFTSDKFLDPYTCQAMPIECAFFSQLAAGGSAHYHLLAKFHYSLPWFLPQIKVGFVNPEIRIYEREQ